MIFILLNISLISSLEFLPFFSQRRRITNVILYVHRENITLHVTEYNCSIYAIFKKLQCNIIYLSMITIYDKTFCLFPNILLYISLEIKVNCS